MSTQLFRTALLCAAFTLLTSKGATAQNTLRVPSQHPDIQAALNAAATGDTVLIEPGLYSANNLDPLGKEVTIRGEFGPQLTVLDGQLAGRLFVVQNGEGSGLVIADLTLRRAFAPAGQAGGALRVSGTASPTVRNCRFELCAGELGTAIAVLEESSLLVEESSITRNRADRFGAILIGPSANLTLRQCDLIDNRTAPTGNGGGLISTPPPPAVGNGIGSLRLEACTVRNNEALANLVGVKDLDVSLHDCVFEQHVLQRPLVEVDLNQVGNTFDAVDCVFRNNVSAGQLVVASLHSQNPITVQHCCFADNRDGPVRGTLVAERGQLTLEDSTFARNQADAQFGVILFAADGSPGRIRRCRIVDNWTNSPNGVVRVITATDVRVESCLIARNVNAGPVSAVGGAVDIEHCTIVDNDCTASLPVGQGAVLTSGSVQSSILRGNTPLQLPPAGTTLMTVTHCNVEGGIAGTGNFDADPLFLDEGDDSWHLSSTSPCRDAGAASTTLLDLDGTPRNTGTAPDVGCDEVPEQPFASTDDDFELVALADGGGDPYAPVLDPAADTPLDLILRSPNGNLVGEAFLMLGEVRANGAAFPVLLPGLHIDLASPGFLITYHSAAAPLPIGGLGLPSEGFALRFATPGGLTGWTAWLQAVSLTAAANNGVIAMTRAVQVRLP